ncbi:MAG: hypothetical protein ACJ8FY_24830 [Gemmataceae bacterium]
MNDDIVEPIRQIREELIKRYGGIDGYLQHCQAQERTLAKRAKSRRSKQARPLVRKQARPR